MKPSAAKLAADYGQLFAGIKERVRDAGMVRGAIRYVISNVGNGIGPDLSAPGFRQEKNIT
jgi:hypothetical protein